MGSESSQMQPPTASQHPQTTTSASTAASHDQNNLDMDETHTDSDRARDSYLEQLITNEPGVKIKKDKDVESRARTREALAERLDLAEGQLLLLTESSTGGRKKPSLTAGQQRILERSRSRVEKITAAMTKWDKGTSRIIRKQEKRRAVVPEVALDAQAESKTATEPLTNEDEDQVARESAKRGSKRKKETATTVPEQPVEAGKKRRQKRKTSEGHEADQASASYARTREATDAMPPPQQELEEEPQDAPADEQPEGLGEELGEEAGTHNAGTEIPTPPESHRDSADEVSQPVNDEDAHLDGEDAASSIHVRTEGQSPKKKRTRTVESASANTGEEQPEPSRKRIRRSKHREDDEEEFVVPASSDEEQAKASRKRVRKSAPKHAEDDEARLATVAATPPQPANDTARMEWSERPTTAAGPFTAAERDIADRVFKEVLKMDRISEAELKAKIKDWRKAGTFRLEIEAALPARSKASVRKFCQRKYHTNERGPWTAEQDEALREAYAQYPGEWTKLSDLVDRHPGDCKDRWTLHLQYGDKKETGPWSKDEEDKLLAAVKECVWMITKDNQDSANDREYIESMISWKVVAEKLGLTRSTKSCREKYDKIKNRSAKYEHMEPPEAEQKEVSTKRARGEAAVKQFEIGDFYDVFTEIHESFDDVTKVFNDEIVVVYSVTSAKHPASRFNLMTRDSAIRRVALETALKEWKIDSKKFKRRLEKAETIPAQAKVLARLLEKQYAGRLHAMARTFRVDLIGKDADEIMRMKKERSEKWYAAREARANGAFGQASAKPAHTKSKPSSMSKEFVEDSSDDEADVLRDPESSGDDADQERANAKQSDAKLADFDDEDEQDIEGDQDENESIDEAPATQVAPHEKDDAKLPPSATTARFAEGLTGTANLAPSDFLKRCRKAGRVRDGK